MEYFCSNIIFHLNLCIEVSFVILVKGEHNWEKLTRMSLDFGKYYSQAGL